MPMRASRDPGRICDACQKPGSDVLFIAWGGKTLRACGDCLNLLTQLRIQLATDPTMDSVERYV